MGLGRRIRPTLSARGLTRVRLRFRVGMVLIRLADRVGPAHRFTYWTFTFEPDRGCVFRADGYGCPVMFRDDLYHRAHSEAGER